MADLSPVHHPESDTKKQTQNLLALSIILGGLFLGSLFVDFVQLIDGEGFSSLATRTHHVLEASGRTWVAYTDPRVELTVITDDTCEACRPNEALVWLRRVIPTIEAEQIDIRDEYGSRLAERLGIVTLPAFIFSKDILHTNFYLQASSLFQSREGRYVFDMNTIGLPVGRYLKLPHVSQDAIASGPSDAKVTIVEYSDFECSFCKKFHSDLKAVAAQYEGEVRLVYKHLPLSFHAQAENAALAAQCANDQGKFDSYADHLFAKQAEWSKTSGMQKFKDYAWWLKLDYRMFSSCLDDGTLREAIARDKEEGANLNITSTPATFINGTFVDGAVSREELASLVEAALQK